MGHELERIFDFLVDGLPDSTAETMRDTHYMLKRLVIASLFLSWAFCVGEVLVFLAGAIGGAE